MAEGYISDEDIQKVREANDIVTIISEYASVKQRGRDFWCCCPFHNEKTPSLKIDTALQLWHCFGCGEGGDIFGFIMKADDVTFPEAVLKLAERAHIDISVTNEQKTSSSKKARLREVCKATAEFYHTQLMRNPDESAAEARAYLAGRGFGGEVPKRWTLGFAPGRGALIHHLSAAQFSSEEMMEANVATRATDGHLRDRFFNRIMFPIFDAQGECIAFGGRVVNEGEPKYLNSQETPIFHKSQVLYGLDKAKSSMTSTGVAVVVEGYTDVIALHEAGLCNVVATLGTALTKQHIRILSRHAKNKIVYLFDGDAAGQRAADRALQFIDATITSESGKTQIELCAVTLPDNLDPAEFVQARGIDELQSLLESAKPLISYGIDRRLDACDLSTAEGRIRALNEALSVLAPIKDSLLAKDYAVQIASRVHVREQDALNQLAALRAPRKTADDSYAETSQIYTQDQKQVASDDAGQNFSNSDAAASNSQRVQLSAPERNRLRFERELLSLLAQNPPLALQYADTLAQTHWHDSIHAMLAQSLLSTLADDQSASAATIISNAQNIHDQATGILTSSSSYDEASPEDIASYLAEELSLGDTEETIAELKAQLDNSNDITDDELAFTFNELVALQRDLAQKRKSHKPLTD